MTTNFLVKFKDKKKADYLLVTKDLTDLRWRIVDLYNGEIYPEKFGTSFDIEVFLRKRCDFVEKNAIETTYVP